MEMSDRDTHNAESNFSLFEDCLASRVFVLPSVSDPEGDSEDLDEFSLYIAQEAWLALPSKIRELTFTISPIPEADEVVLDIQPSSTDSTDTLATYGLISSGDSDESHTFLRYVLISYISLATKPPPAWSSTRTNECEICSREVPLTYHHLIPRSTHERVIKRGWHPPEMLNNVAWLC
ncbi:hypothetical protein A7U60_g5134 [Sanghuangporus baumii]|nr:hypothetical protein A7U60_g5134 [Sanghuangporus baumii]